MAQRGLESVEFNGRPAVLIFADGASARARAVRTAELAGCRVSDVAGIGGAVERLGRQAGLAAAFLEVETGSAKSCRDCCKPWKRQRKQDHMAAWSRLPPT